MKRFFVFFVILLMSVLTSYAADAYNKAVTIVENHDQVLVVFDDAIGTDSTGSIHSRPIYIGDMNDNDAYISVIANAASDINVIFHYSMDRRNWTTVTPADLDACSNTAKLDTLGSADDVSGTFFHVARWLVVEKDGQTGANSTDQLYMSIVFHKDVDPVRQDGSSYPTASQASKSITNP